MMDELIAQLEAATEQQATDGNRGLDIKIHNALGFTTQFPEEKPLRLSIPLPHYTTSIDHALVMMPEGAFIQITIETPMLGADHASTVKLFTTDQLATGGELNASYGVAPTPALALCIAALKARAALSVKRDSDG